MWSDNESEIDLLQFRYLASAVSRITRTAHLLPTTIGVFGDWGSGKSSLLKMVEADLKHDPDIMCLSFSGWLFEGYEDAKTALMGSILESIQDRVKEDETFSDRGKKLLESLIKRINWMQVASTAGRYALPTIAGQPHITALMAGSDVAQGIFEFFKGKGNASTPPTVDEIQKLLNDAPGSVENVRRNIRDFHRDFADLIKETKLKVLVVFIDDLDRCLPDTIIETLEAIKLFLFAPGTAFVLGADERLIQYAVRQRFPELPGVETEVGRDYLEKLIQFPIRIPPLSGAEIESYINTLFSQICLDATNFEKVCASLSTFTPNNISDVAFNLSRAREVMEESSITLDLQQDFDLTAQIAPVLTPGLAGNPRRTKRFLNALLLRMEMSKDRGLDLQRQVLAKLMLLEYLKPEFFKQLANLQAAQEGKPKQLQEVEDYLRKSESNLEIPDNSAEKADPSATNQLAAENTQPSKSVQETKSVTKEAKEAKRLDDTAPIHTKAKMEFSAEVNTWLADQWMHGWVKAEPKLASTDLRPYFYVAHDKIGALDVSPVRLSPIATEVLNKLLDSGEATRSLGLNQSANLTQPDATAVFENLAQRIRQAESLNEASLQKVLFAFLQKRPELAPQLVALYSALPETKITASTPGLILEVTSQNSSSEAGQQLLSIWAKSKKTVLAKAAKAILQRSQSIQ